MYFASSMHRIRYECCHDNNCNHQAISEFAFCGKAKVGCKWGSTKKIRHTQPYVKFLLLELFRTNSILFQNRCAGYEHVVLPANRNQCLSNTRLFLCGTSKARAQAVRARFLFLVKIRCGGVLQRVHCAPSAHTATL